VEEKEEGGKVQNWEFRTGRSRHARSLARSLVRSPRARVRDDNFNAHSSPPINQQRRIRYTR
jgi:hypothetical protein